MKPHVEVKIGSFITCDECDVVPETTFFVLAENIEKVNWLRLITQAVAAHVKEIGGGPFTNARPMSFGEIDQYKTGETP